VYVEVVAGERGREESSAPAKRRWRPQSTVGAYIVLRVAWSIIQQGHKQASKQRSASRQEEVAVSVFARSLR